MKKLVLFHGWGTTGRIWQSQTAAFDRRVEVLAPDIPAWDLAWVKNYLAGMPLGSCVLVGWSLGGMLLLEALADMKAAPGAVILVAAAASFCRRPDHPWGQPAAAVRAMRRGLLQDGRAVVREFALNCLAPEEEAFREKVLSHFDNSASPEHLASGLEYLLRQDCRMRLGEIITRSEKEIPSPPPQPSPLKGEGVKERNYFDAQSNISPIIIVQGKADAIVPAAQARFLHKHLVESRLHLFPGTGHLPFLTQAARFNEVLEEIFGSSVDS